MRSTGYCLLVINDITTCYSPCAHVNTIIHACCAGGETEETWTRGTRSFGGSGDLTSGEGYGEGVAGMRH